MSIWQVSKEVVRYPFHVGHQARLQEVEFVTCVSLIVWYIPPHWLRPSDALPNTIVEAAHLTHNLATASSYTIPHSTIPLIVHQTWKDTKVNIWPQELADGVEKWLDYATVEGNASMAYFFWLDSGCKQLIAEFEPQIVDIVEALPLQVEKSDIFRVLVLNSIGGIVSVYYNFRELTSLRA